MFESTVYNEWHQSLGQRVCVQETTYGTLRYFGETHFAEGLWCGIELDEAVGENNGKVDDVHYFTCENKFGLFVPVSETSLKIQNSDVNENSKCSLINQIKVIKEFHNDSKFQKDIHNLGIVSSDQFISCDKSSPKCALNESYTISSNFPDKNTLSVIDEESAQILDISSINFSNILSQTIPKEVSSNELEDVYDQNIKENGLNFLESTDSLGILSSALLEDLSSDDFLYHSEASCDNLKSTVNLPDDMSKELNNKFQEIISNSPAHSDMDEVFHPIRYAANSSFFCIQNCESPVFQNDSSLPKFASTPKHETNFSDISDEIERALNLTHNLFFESHVHHNVLETANKDVEYAKSVSKDGTYIGETHLSITPVNEGIKDSNVQYIDGISESINYADPTAKSIKDLSVTQSMERIAKYVKHSKTESIDLNVTRCVENSPEDLKYTESNEGIKDLNVHCAHYIEVSENDIDLNVTRSIENISEDLKYMSLNESVKEVDVTRCVEGIPKNVKYSESPDENIRDLNVTQCIAGISEDLKNNQSFNKEFKHLNVTQCIEEVSEDLINNQSFNKEIKDLNVTQCIEGISEDLKNKSFNKEIKDLNVTQCIEEVSEDLKNNQLFNKEIKDLNVTQYIEEVSEDLINNQSFNKKVKDLNVTQCIEGISEDLKNNQSFNKEIKDLNVTQCIEEVSEDLKNNQSFNKEIKDLNVTQCIEGISEDLKNKSFNKEIKDLNVTQCIEGISEDLNCNESLNDLYLIQSIGSISDDFKYSKSLGENIKGLNATRYLENRTENLLSITSTYLNQPDHSSEEYCNMAENESSSKVQKDQILYEKTSEVLNIPCEKYLKLPELNVNIECLQSSKLPKVSMKENINSLKCDSKSRGRKRDFYAKSEISSNDAKIKFERHTRKNVGCFANKSELKTSMYDKQVRRNSLLSNASTNEKQVRRNSLSSNSSTNEKQVRRNSLSSNVSTNEKQVRRNSLSSNVNTYGKQVRRNSLSNNVSTSSTGDIPETKVISSSKELSFRFVTKQNFPISPLGIVTCQSKLTGREIPVSRSGVITGNSRNNLRHSTLKFEPSNFNVDIKEAKQSTLVEFHNEQDSLNETVCLANQINKVEKAVIKNTRSTIQNFSKNNCISSTLKFNPPNSLKEDTQSFQVPSEDNKDCLFNETIYLDDQIDDVGKTVVKKPRSSMNFFSNKKTDEQSSIPYRNSKNLLNEDKHLDCETNKVRNTDIKKPSSMQFSSVQSSSSVHNNIPCRDTKERLSNEVEHLDYQIEEVGKTVTKKPRSSMNFFNKISSELNSIPCKNNSESLFNEVKYVDHQINECGKTVIKKPRCSMKFSTIQNSSSVHNSVPYGDAKERLVNEVEHLDCQIEEVGKTVTKKPRSSINLFNKISSEHNSSPCRRNAESSFNEAKCVDHHINEVGRTIIKKPRCSMKFSTIQSSSSVHTSIPYRNTKERLFNKVEHLDCQIEEVGKTVTKKPRSSLNLFNKMSSEHNSSPCRSNTKSLFNEVKYVDNQINEVRKTILKKPSNSVNFANIPQTSSDHSSIPSRSKMTSNKNRFSSKCDDYLNKETEKLSFGSTLNDKQNKIAGMIGHPSSEKPKSAIPPPNRIGGNKPPIAFKSSCISQRGIPNSASRAISNDAIRSNQETSCKQTTEGKLCHQMNLRRPGSLISKIKPPTKYS